MPATGTGLGLNLKAGGFANRSGVTRRLFRVASQMAVDDPYHHGEQSSACESPAPMGAGQKRKVLGKQEVEGSAVYAAICDRVNPQAEGLPHKLGMHRRIHS